MSSVSPTLPVLVMTRNDGHFLKQCVESIINTVTIPVTIYIIDNHSDSPEHHGILNGLKARFNNVELVLNKKNLWILGLNKTIKKIRNMHNSKYFFLTDADINFSDCKARPCWLSYLIKKLDSNASIGKIGISLSWDYLEKHDELLSILEQEKALYSEGHKIDDLYVSAVDTTASLFRFDWSLENSSFFYPDHMRYLKPELYSCRTPRDICVEHLGWLLYKRKESLSLRSVNSKVLCFTFVGGSIKDTILSSSSFHYALFYKLFSRLFFVLWMSRRYFYLFKYIMKKGRKKFDGHGV